MNSEYKDRFSFKMLPSTRVRIDQWYEADNCRSRNEFIEKAVNFYVDYLEVQDNRVLLPKAILSAINGRLDTMENRIGSVLYKQAVEADMVMGIAADLIKIDEEDLRKRRAKSVQNVKATNGRLSLEEKVREKEFDDG